MVDVLGILAMILGLGLLMVVHEGGHLLVARAFGMRVVKFSIGFGPTIWRHQPKDSPTTYQIAVIPFLAYVQIAGMNPFEENDPDDKGSYANASLTGRLATIIAGPAANYLLASVILFFIFLFAGVPTASRLSMAVEPSAPNMPAAMAGFESGDRITAVDGAAVTTPEEVKKAVVASPDAPLTFTVERDGKPVQLTATPMKVGTATLIGVSFKTEIERNAVSFGEAVGLGFTYPAQRAYELVTGLPTAAASMKHAKDDPDKVQLASIWFMLKYGGKLLQEGPVAWFTFLAMISMALAVFNMLPIPALDGGRLMFLGYEAVTRRKPNPKIEAQIHAVGFLMLIGMAVVILTVDMRRSSPEERFKKQLSDEANSAEGADTAGGASPGATDPPDATDPSGRAATPGTAPEPKRLPAPGDQPAPARNNAAVAP